MLLLDSRVDDSLVAALRYASAADAVLDPRGRTVRCTPDRRTVAVRLDDGRCLFRKLRTTRPGRAFVEWRVLEELARIGVPVPRRVFLARLGRRTALGMLAAPGRALDSLLESTAEPGRDPRVRRYLVERVAPVVRHLHDQGLCFRDLYWNHLFATGFDPGVGWPTFIDVERVFRPRGRFDRWRVKDLAGLLATWPGPAPRALALRFLLTYSGADHEWDRRLARSVMAKAARIRAHRPRFG
jgi:hypothetical protein